MLSLLAFAMVACFMTLIMTKRLSAIVALIVVPHVVAVPLHAPDQFEKTNPAADVAVSVTAVPDVYA